jgi:hypothetical protein
MSLHWPLCVSYQRPPAPAEAVTRRERWIRWRRTPFTEPDPVWAAEPDLKLVEQIANEHKWMCGFSGCKNVSVEFFKEGAINKLYIISAIETHTGNPIERILRSSMPIHPWFTIQSEVATMEFVRLQTTIPVPRVYIFDSSGENELGLEWMIMEKIDGHTLGSVLEAELSMLQKERVYRDVAGWVHQLSTLQFDKIGSLYCRWNAFRSPILGDFTSDQPQMSSSHTTIDRNMTSFVGHTIVFETTCKELSNYIRRRHWIRVNTSEATFGICLPISNPRE